MHPLNEDEFIRHRRSSRGGRHFKKTSQDEAVNKDHRQEATDTMH